MNRTSALRFTVRAFSGIIDIFFACYPFSDTACGIQPIPRAAIFCIFVGICEERHFLFGEFVQYFIAY